MPLPPGFLETARALIRTDTSPGQGTRAAAGLLAPLYEAAGLRVSRQGDETGEGNVLAGPGGAAAAPGGAPLVTHLRTVPPRPQERWTGTGGDPRALTAPE